MNKYPVWQNPDTYIAFHSCESTALSGWAPTMIFGKSWTHPFESKYATIAAQLMFW